MDPSTSTCGADRCLEAFGSDYATPVGPPTDAISLVHPTTHLSPLSVIVRISEAYAARDMGLLSRGNAVCLGKKALAPVVPLAQLFGVWGRRHFDRSHRKRYGPELTNRTRLVQ